MNKCSRVDITCSTRYFFKQKNPLQNFLNGILAFQDVNKHNYEKCAIKMTCGLWQGFKFYDEIGGKKETKGVNDEKRNYAMPCMDTPTHSRFIDTKHSSQIFLHSLIFSIG